MLAVRALSASPESPLDALEVGEVPDAEIEDAAPAGWVPVTLRAMALNQHDVWSLRGVGLAEEHLPMVLGCDGAGVTDDGREVIVHAVITRPEWSGPETQDPKRSILSERHNGTLAERVWVPQGNLVPKPATLSFEEAACLPVAWLTAFSMLGKAQLNDGDTVLVQGAGGGVSTALVSLGSALGYRVWVTSRSEEKAARVKTLGAAETFESGARLPERVDAVMESVGQATWAHSLRSLRPGGTIVTCGATSGGEVSAELNRLFFQQLRVLGSTMGSRQELEALAALVADRGIHPVIDSVRPLADARSAFERMIAGDAFGKLVLTA
jgi:NADPH:quinone reductase-like Zn-dependent oxidoreductase